MNKAITLASNAHAELEQLLIARAQLEQAHQQAVTDLDNKINLCNAKLAAALSMAESQ